MYQAATSTHLNSALGKKRQHRGHGQRQNALRRHYVAPQTAHELKDSAESFCIPNNAIYMGEKEVEIIKEIILCQDYLLQFKVTNKLV